MTKDVSAKDLGLYNIQIICNTILYPGLVVFLMWRIGFIKSIFMREARERLGPLIASMLFFFWNYYVFYKLTEVPELFKIFLLGVFISTSTLFILTIFAKISMHTTSIGGALAALILAQIYYPCSMVTYLALAVIATILVSVSRLGLKVHTKAEVITGLLVGVMSQFVAFGLYRFITG
jgi:membrane-associated phospholipid phosphatase